VAHGKPGGKDGARDDQQDVEHQSQGARGYKHAFGKYRYSGGHDSMWP
jgi:hypothetical protein